MRDKTNTLPFSKYRNILTIFGEKNKIIVSPRGARENEYTKSTAALLQFFLKALP
jgi:hypothetical protein